MKLLIAYDGSSPSDAVLEDLLWAGIPDGSEALVVSVAEVWHPLEPATSEALPLPPYVPTGLKGLRERATTEMEQTFAIAERAADRLRREFPGWHIRAEAYADSPAGGIITQADEWGADLIVVGSHGRSLLGRMMLGSVSQKVLTESRRSVRIARRRTRREGPSRILVGVDGSPDSQAAVAALLERSWPSGAAVRVVSALDLFFPTSITPASAELVDWFEESYRQERERIEAAVADAVRRMTDVGLLASQTIREGAPKALLLSEAKEWDADMIFLGARGVQGFERFLLGSVSAAVASRAHCSVEVVRSANPVAENSEHEHP
jgi:nucleotide-binding universal stress UspA family protein